MSRTEFYRSTEPRFDKFAQKLIFHFLMSISIDKKMAQYIFHFPVNLL